MTQSDKKVNIVGSAELVDLPELSLGGVPAKVDTGADSSAIWASDIKEQNNQLSFVLFDQKSPFYSGQVITTRQYSVISVKNSFGQTEVRYKVSLKIRLAGRTIKTRFTLANREANRFPMLIGRKTLHKKFLVDVTKRAGQGEKHVLMISTKRSRVTSQFASNLTRDNANLAVDYATYEDFIFYCGGSRCRIVLATTGQDISEYDLVYFKTTAGYGDQAASMAQYLSWRGVPFIDQAVDHLAIGSKLFQYVMLERSELAPPASVFMQLPRLVKSFKLLSDELGLPFILKDISGSKGNHNYLINDKASFDQACQQARADAKRLIAQTYVPNNGDYRVLVFDNQASLIIKRQRLNDETHLNNTSKGGQASLVPVEELPPALLKNCLEVAGLIWRQIVGIDVVQDSSTGDWYCLELNDGPQLASGSFVKEKHQAFAKYLTKKLG